MALAHVLGFPRIGARRELKFALESFWRGESDETHLTDLGRELRVRHWSQQRDAGLGFVTAGDFAFYDQMLETTLLLGSIPERFGFDAKAVTLAQSFELARGNRQQPAMEMTKWFDTNYHYLVPELDASTRFDGGSQRWFDDIAEAIAFDRTAPAEDAPLPLVAGASTGSNGCRVKPVLIGPVTYLRLAKSHEVGFDKLSLLPAIVDAYARILDRLASLGIEWVQVDEPALCLDLDADWLRAIDTAYARLGRCGPKLLLATYFESVAEHAPRLVALPVHGFHVDLVRAPDQLGAWLAALPDQAVLSAGIVDGRNIWKCDLRKALATLEPVHRRLGDRLWIAPSCSLLHVPVSLAGEHQLDLDVRSWLAFATEKLDELGVLQQALGDRPAIDPAVGIDGVADAPFAGSTASSAVARALAASDAAQQSRRDSKRVVNTLVRRRVASVTDAMAERRSGFAQRIVQQQASLKLPPLPTTTIGSFPQTPAIRQTRAAFKRGEIKAMEYLARIRGEIEFAVRKQEALGLDVLVHGEAERNDMVEYFGEQLWGYAFSANGWVQSYGSRCVKPPILYGDIYRPEPMTVDTTRYAQSLTDKPMKGMLTGPITMLQWSFVRDDQPRRETALQLALAIREEVADLEKAGIRVIQIDEPALREGLPLKRRDWAAYLDWAVRAFKLGAAVAADTTQIHTHMCYAEFNDILPSIAAMDADVITIETSRSAMELLDGFGAFAYPNDIGPGVYDIHSPRVPSVEAMLKLIERAAGVVPADRLWINPDCGLKTRGWPETEAALGAMVEAAKRARAAIATLGTVSTGAEAKHGAVETAAVHEAHGVEHRSPHCWS